jgi:hypothetical protein
MKKLFLLLMITAALTLGLVGLKTYAVDAPSTNAVGQALEIAPPVINLTANPGQTLTAHIDLRDITDGNLIVTNQINDFVAAGEDGTPKIILNADPNNPNSLRSWVQTIPQMLLKSHEIKKIDVTINVPQTASPGGYYGVIRFTGTPPNLKGTGVSLSASLGSLVLIKVNGAAKESMSVSEFSVNHNGSKGSILQSTPLQFVERIKNTGNMFEQPSGLVTVTDMFGKKVATLNVNAESSNVLPQSIRKFDQALDKTVIGNKRLFGHYTAHLKLTYGEKNKVLTQDIGFWIIPYKLIGIIILLLIICFFGIRLFIKRYNKHIITKAQSSRRR